MRLDYFHTGTATEEQFALDGVALEGPWPGPPDRALDTTNLGKYFFVVIDRKTNLPLYSRGFASMYGEWELTPEARLTSGACFTNRCAFPCRRVRCRWW